MRKDSGICFDSIRNLVRSIAALHCACSILCNSSGVQHTLGGGRVDRNLPSSAGICLIGSILTDTGAGLAPWLGLSCGDWLCACTAVTYSCTRIGTESILNSASFHPHYFSKFKGLPSSLTKACPKVPITFWFLWKETACAHLGMGAARNKYTPVCIIPDRIFLSRLVNHWCILPDCQVPSVCRKLQCWALV